MDRIKLSGEIQIKGLSNKSIEECIDRYFDMEEKYESEPMSDDPTLELTTSDEPPISGEEYNSGATSGDSSQIEVKNSDSKKPQTKLKRQDLIQTAKNRGVYEFLRIPILLLMLSVLFVETGSLPERETDIIWEIVQIYIKRAKEKGIELEDPDILLRHLGKLSYDASQRESHQLMIKKVRI